MGDEILSSITVLNSLFQSL